METARKLQQLIAAIMVMIFAAYYCETTLFIHTHLSPEGRVTHSHPFVPGSQHSHSATDCAFLSIAGQFDSDTTVSTGFVAKTAICILALILCAPVCLRSVRVNSPHPLRAPPAW